MEKLFGKTLVELQALVAKYELPQFTAKQIADWLYKKEITSIHQMSNLSQKARELLAVDFEVGLTSFSDVKESKDGTRKYLFNVEKGSIETAMIPDKERKTLCVSSQVGCKMNCLFCMTGKQGFQAQLSAGEIVNQLRMVEEWKDITNIVYMGMGEPLDNWVEVKKSTEILTSDWGYGMSPRRITISTIGVGQHIQSFLSESECHLAVSLHNPFDAERLQLMPIQKVFPIQSIIDEIKKFDFNGQRRVSFEYIMFKDLNDTPRHAQELVRLLHGINCRVNLIKYHQIPGVDLKTSSPESVEEFKSALIKKHLFTTLRTSRGEDVFAACGLLSTLKKE